MKVIDSIKNEVIKIMDNDPAHDFEHVMRVYNNAQKIAKKEKANQKLVLSAALLHDIVSYPKSSKRSKFSSIDSAKKSKLILKKYDFTEKKLQLFLMLLRIIVFLKIKFLKHLKEKYYKMLIDSMH